MQIQPDLKGRTALVTGSTSGIGWGIACALADCGARIVLNGYGDPDLVRELSQELEQRSGQVPIIWQVDLTQSESILARMGELPHIDILVNNAGMQHTAPVDQFPALMWEKILSLNLSAAFYLISGLLPGMREQGWGRIINVASVHGLVASVEKAAYVAAKHGLVGLTKVVALEEARGAVTCNAICPGWVLTPLVEKQILDLADQQGCSRDQAERQLLGQKQPSMRFTQPSELGVVAAFLCSEAAANMTGISLPVDGGWLAQ